MRARKYGASVTFDSSSFLTNLAILLIVCGITVGYPTVRIFGFYPNWSTGFRDGVITKASTKGWFWKTNELILNRTIGEYDRNMEQVFMSCPGPAAWEKVKAAGSKKVRVYYTEWYLGPWSKGSENRHVTDVVPLPEIEEQ